MIYAASCILLGFLLGFLIGSFFPNNLTNIYRDAKRKIKAEKMVKILADACDLVHKKAYIVQPFLSIWKTHGNYIEEIRERHK